MSMLTMSGLPRAAQCPGHLALPHANTTSSDSEAGTDNHATAEQAVLDGEWDRLPDEVRALFQPGDSAHPEAVCYYDYVRDTARIDTRTAGHRVYEAGPNEIPGTIDLLVRRRDIRRIIVLDYKRHADVGNPDENEQLMGYALAAARGCQATEVMLVVAYIDASEDGSLKLVRPLVVRTIDEIELDAYAAKLRGIVAAVAAQRANVTPDVRENRHCKHCPAAAHCPAKVALIKRLVSGEERDDLELMMPLTADTARKAYERLGHARALLKRIETAIYAFASQQDIPLGDGRVLGKRMKRGNESLDGNVVHAVIGEMFGPDIADAAIGRTATKVGIERAIKKLAKEPESPVRSVAGTVNLVLEAVRERGGSKHEDKETIDEHPAELAAGRKAG